MALCTVSLEQGRDIIKYSPESLSKLVWRIGNWVRPLPKSPGGRKHYSNLRYLKLVERSVDNFHSHVLYFALLLFFSYNNGNMQGHRLDFYWTVCYRLHCRADVSLMYTLCNNTLTWSKKWIQPVSINDVSQNYTTVTEKDESCIFYVNTGLSCSMDFVYFLSEKDYYTSVRNFLTPSVCIVAQRERKS